MQIRKKRGGIPADRSIQKPSAEFSYNAKSVEPEVQRFYY